MIAVRAAAVGAAVMAVGVEVMEEVAVTEAGEGMAAEVVVVPVVVGEVMQVVVMAAGTEVTVVVRAKSLLCTLWMGSFWSRRRPCLPSCAGSRPVASRSPCKKYR